MTVGTNIGNTYRGQQGTGFATVNEYDPSADLAIAKMKQQQEMLDAEKAAKAAEKLSKSHAKMLESKPDYWYRHDQEIMEMQNAWIDMGGAMIANGVDPYTGMDEDSLNFRKLQSQISAYSSASKQLREDWTKTQAAYKDQKSRKEIENWDEIVAFYDNPSIIDIVNGKKLAPQPKFKAPEISTYKLAAERVTLWKGDQKDKVLSMDDAVSMALEMQMDETMNEGFGNANSKFRQRYNSIIEALPEDEKEKYDARGAKRGTDGYTQYLAEYLYGFTDPSMNLDDVFLKKAKSIQTSMSEIEEGAVTKKSVYSKFNDNELRKLVRAELESKDGYIEREVSAGRYGNPDKSVSFNLKAAEDYYLQILKDNIKTGYSKTEDEGAAGKAKLEESREMWYQAITGALGEDAQRRAEAQILNTQIDGKPVTQVFPRPGGIRVNFGDETGRKKTMDYPIEGVPKEDVLNLYDQSLRAGRKIFKIEESSIDDLYDDDLIDNLINAEQ